MPGWHEKSWGYHGDDGKKFNSPTSQGLRYSETYTTGDTVGCGINRRTGKIFFTLNGFNQGKYFQQICARRLLTPSMNQASHSPM